MKAVQGFLTNDERFFNTQEAAEEHEAREELRTACAELGIKWESLENVLEQAGSEVRRYLEATGRNTVVDPSNNGKGQESLGSLLEQPLGGDEPMPDVGTGEYEETIRRRRARSRLRSGGN